MKRQSAPPRHRRILNLNQGWKFLLGCPDADPVAETDGQLSWEMVSLPHAARLEPLNASGGRNFQGVCWYQRSILLDAGWSSRLIYLHFEGAMQVADVWLNGRQIFTHFGGYTPFTLDITPHVRFDGGDNILTLRLDNSDNPQVPPGKPQRELDFTYFAGLYRNVRMEILNRLHVTDVLLADKVAGGGVFVTYPHVSEARATVRVDTHVANEHDEPRHCTVTQELADADADGRVVAIASPELFLNARGDATVSQMLELTDPQLWHPHHPHLYTLRTLISDERGVVDDQVQKIGVRHIRFDKDDGLFINGEKFFSLGANRHQDHPYVGYALPDSAHRRDVKKLREGGFTSFRSHYPQSPAFMDACDELGMLTIVSNPGWQYVGDALFRSRAIRNARIMVRRDRNRPSVILWEAALNESDNEGLCGRLHAGVHAEYPGDQCYTAGDREHGGAAAAAAADCWDVEFLGNDGSRPYWIREWGDAVDNWSDQQSSNRVARGWGETPMLVQAWSHLSRLNELMVSHHGGSDSGRDGRRLGGACLWAGIDAQRGYHHQPFYGGLLDLFRLPKFSYYLFQSQRPPGVHVPGLDDGPMVFIANFATFLSPTAITVFSNCEEVRLFQAGAEIGRMQATDAPGGVRQPFTFRVDAFAPLQSTMYMTGVAEARAGGAGGAGEAMRELRAEGLIDGKVVAMHIVRPPGAPAKLVLKADLCGVDLTADDAAAPAAAAAADWVRVHASVCDARGTVCPFADDMIQFDVEGEGTLIGGPAIGANPMRAEAGIATALVRATALPGTIHITASAFGLSPARIELVSHPPPRRVNARHVATDAPARIDAALRER